MNDTIRTNSNLSNSTGKGTSTRASRAPVTSRRLGNAQAPQVRIAAIAAIYLAYGTVDPHRIPHGSS